MRHKLRRISGKRRSKELRSRRKSSRRHAAGEADLGSCIQQAHTSRSEEPLREMISRASEM